jgi:oligogalacturonide transport system substrate-binding protein
MQKKVKKTLILMLVFVFAISFVACKPAGQSDGTTTAPTGNVTTAPTEPQENITLRFSWWGADTRHQATLAAMELYTQKHPNVKIEGEYGAFSSFYQKLLTQLSGRTAPDIISVDYKWTHDLINQGKPFVNMNTLTDKIDMSGFDLDFARIYGGDQDYLIGLPAGVNGMGYLYNIEFLKANGIEPNNEWDWETVIENGKKVQAKDSSKYLMYNISEHWVYLVKTMLKQINGNTILNSDYTLGFSKEDIMSVFDYIKRLVETKTIPPFEEGVLYENVYADQNPNWLNQSFGVFPTSSSLIPGITSASNFELDVLRYPVLKDAKDPGILVTPSVFITVYENSKYKDAAADFINFFFNDEESIKILKDTRGVPANSKAKEILVQEGVIPEQVSNMVAQSLTGAGVAENGPSLNPEVIALIKDYVQQVGYLKLTPEKAADEFIKELEALAKTLK